MLLKIQSLCVKVRRVVLEHLPIVDVDKGNTMAPLVNDVLLTTSCLKSCQNAPTNAFVTDMRRSLFAFRGAVNSFLV